MKMKGEIHAMDCDIFHSAAKTLYSYGCLYTLNKLKLIV